jgi:hypothetical protein
MSRLWAKIIGLGLLAGLLLPGIAAAAANEESFLVLVADSRKLTGWEAWWANLYNESHLYFTLVTVIIIPVVGLCFGLLADVVMSRIGLDLKSRELAEH